MFKRVYSLETEYALTHKVSAGIGAVAARDLYGLLSEALKSFGPWAECDPTTAREQASRQQIVRLDEGYFVGNGARFYQDSGLVEWAGPETSNPWAALLYDLAADRELAAAAQAVIPQLGEGRPLLVKNNINYRTRTSYGCHENYSVAARLMAGYGQRRTVAALVPFLVTRQIICGAGRIGSFRDQVSPLFFQLSQRADLITTEASVDTRENRPIVNTREEPLADARRYARLHLIVGDSNMAQISNLLKLGMTGLVLDMLESDAPVPDIRLADPVEAIRAVSCDMTFKRQLTLAGRGSETALGIQRAYWRAARDFAAREYPHDSIAQMIVTLWQQVLDHIEQNNPVLEQMLDWAIKRRVLQVGLDELNFSWDEMAAWETILARTVDVVPPEQVPQGGWGAWLRRQLDRENWHFVDAMRWQAGLEWDDYGAARTTAYKLRAMDVRYHEIDPEHSLFHRLPVQTVIDDVGQIHAAQRTPPSDTRAHVRGEVLRRVADHNREQPKLMEVVMDWHFLRRSNSSRDLHLPDPLDHDTRVLDDWLGPSRRMPGSGDDLEIDILRVEPLE